MFNNNQSPQYFQVDYKEDYIVNMLIRTLYSNEVTNAECYRIIKKFKEKVIGDMML